ncbi:hypothetical protein BDR05DRAFT_1013616 [Suillus weaverae]|nr:hypothetical protein BDR05DRAFT_1013616 [Suillus weaverae]
MLTPHQHRCQDCLDSQLYCCTCIVKNHVRLPTHIIQEWNSYFFQHISLKNMGLCVQLGHTLSDWCILPQRAFNDDFVLIDTNGIHEIGLDFCGCKISQTHTKQILCVGWFPSTSTDSQTAATFRVLHHYQILSFESKASAYEFYHSLVHLTDNTGLRRQKDCYESFMHMVREWHHLVMLKCSRRGHDLSGVMGTSEGQCTVLCPACPQPGKNLPDNWKDTPKTKSWLYGLFLAIDANFCLKRCAAYFMEESSYKSHILDRAGETQEKSTCSSHNAVNMADTKLSQGLAAMGVGMVDCAWHNMKRPNGVGDLQKGEKYMNMDYLFFSTLQHSVLDILNVSYDIACQWHKHLWSRMLTLPPSHHLNYLSKTVHFFIPKFHLPVHVSKCQTIFSFNFTHFVGHTDGEAPERGWSNINPIASSMKAMGPGCRRDTLDDHFGDWNWKKVVGLGLSLLSKMKETTAEKGEHRAAFEEFDSVITPENRTAWKAEMEAWEENPNNITVTITQASACLSLAQLEAEELEHGVDLLLHSDISPSVLIRSGIDLEQEQQHLKAMVDSMGIHAMDRQKLMILHTRMSLHRKLEAWRQTQYLNPENAEHMKLWLPSSLNSKACDLHLQHVEWELQFTQAHDALEELRQCLYIHCSLLTFKREWIQGQGANTCAQNALARIHNRQAAYIKRYRIAWGALKSLAPMLNKVDWCGHLQDLLDNDVKPLVDPFGTQGEGRRRLTWIWMMDGMDSHVDGGDADGVRVEWCKSRTRALRWAEEVELLQEEMRHVLQFLEWQADWWAARCDTAAHNEGLSAYAARQADIRHCMAGHFCHLWAPFISPDIMNEVTGFFSYIVLKLPKTTDTFGPGPGDKLPT